MSSPNKIELQIEAGPSGILNLKERDLGDGTWKEVKDDGLLANPDPASFYQRVAKHLAEYARAGIQVIAYRDGGEDLLDRED